MKDLAHSRSLEIHPDAQDVLTKDLNQSVIPSILSPIEWPLMEMPHDSSKDAFKNKSADF